MSLRMRQFSKERGSLIILAMIVIFAMSSIGVTIATVSAAKYSSAKTNFYAESAVAAAEAAVSATIQQLDLSDAFGGYNPTSNRQVLFAGSGDRGKVEYSSEVSTNSDGTKTITAKGYAYRPDGTTAINTKTIKAIVKNQGTSVTASVVAGPGGLLVSQGSVAGKNIFVNGQVNLTGGDLGVGNHANITPPTTVEVDVANVGCGTAANYPQPCGAGNEPIKFGFERDVWGSRVCATNQVTETTGVYSIITGLVKPCTAPSVTMPAYDREAMYTSMLAANGSKATSTIGSCSLFNQNVTIDKDTVYTGNLTLSGNNCTGTIKGNVYFTGNLTTTFFANLKVDDALTTPPVILVDGTINLAGTAVQRNAAGIGAVFISFQSANPTCNTTRSCVSLTPTDLYNSVNTVTVSNESNAYGSVIYSYFGTARTLGTGAVSGIAGQRVWADALTSFSVTVPGNLLHNVSATGLTNNDAFGGRTKIPKWKKVDYQQVYD